MKANEYAKNNDLEIHSERAQGWKTPQKIILDPEYQSQNYLDSVQQVDPKET